MDFNDVVIGLVVVGILGLLAGAWSWAVITAGKLGVEDAFVAWGGLPPGPSSTKTAIGPARRTTAPPLRLPSANENAPEPLAGVGRTAPVATTCLRPLVAAGRTSAHQRGGPDWHV